MNEQSAIEASRAELLDELRQCSKKYSHLAKRNYGFAYMLMTVTLLASLIAGIGGIFLSIDSKVVGAVALLPAALGLAASVLKPQARANWHYRKLDAAEGLRRQLQFEMGTHPTAADIAAVSSALSNLHVSMSAEWEKDLTIEWTAITSEHARAKVTGNPNAGAG